MDNEEMRTRTHLVIAAAAGLAIYPRSRWRAVLLTLAGVFVDIDHYLLYGLRSGDWSVSGALAYNRRRHYYPRAGDTRPRYGSLRSIIHRPAISLPILAGISLSWRAIWPITIGVAVHLALDAYIPLLYVRVWRRANQHCELCHSATRQLEVCYKLSPLHGGSRRDIANRIALCRGCVQAAIKAEKRRNV